MYFSCIFVVFLLQKRSLLVTLLKTDLPLVKNVFQLIIKTILIPSGLMAATAASAAGSGIHKEVLGSGRTTLKISNKEIEDVMKIVKSLDDSGLFTKGAIQTTENETKWQKGSFFGMLSGTLGENLVGNMQAGKSIVREGYGNKEKGVKQGMKWRELFIALQ